MYNVASQCISYVKKNEKIAYGQFLDRVKFDQWHVMESLRGEIKNINVLNLACLLATMPRMDFTGFRISQNSIAKRMTEFYNLDKQPTRQAVSKWEKELERAGLLIIPEKVDFRNYQTKTRVFTDKFNKIARRGLDSNVSDKYIHATKSCRMERVIPDYQKPLAPSHILTENRTRNIYTNSKSSNRAAAPLEKQEPQQNKTLRPIKYRGSGNITRLSKFERSVQWWLSGFNGLKSQSESTLLFAIFLESQQDDFICQLSRGWLGSGGCKFTDTERSFHIRNLVKWLRDKQLEHKNFFGSQAAIIQKEPLQLVEKQPEASNEKSQLDDPKFQNFHKALIFGGDYVGIGKNIVDKFRGLDDQDQDQLLKDIHSGVLKVE